MALVNSNAPIGIFDSGVGGLTVARSIIDQLPGESILYVGDTVRGPYGPRPLAELREFALEIMDKLDEKIDALAKSDKEQHETLKKTMDNVKERVDVLERWRWMIVGGAVVIGYLMGHLELFSRLVNRAVDIFSRKIAVNLAL